MDFIFTYRTRTSSRAESPAGSGGPDASPARGSRVTRRSGFGGGGRGGGRGGTGSLVSPEEEAKRCQTSRWPHKLRNAAQHLTSTTEEHFLLHLFLTVSFGIFKVKFYLTVWSSENCNGVFNSVSFGKCKEEFSACVHELPRCNMEFSIKNGIFEQCELLRILNLVFLTVGASENWKRIIF